MNYIYGHVCKNLGFTKVSKKIVWMPFRSELSMGWVNPWVGLGFVSLYDLARCTSLIEPGTKRERINFPAML